MSTRFEFISGCGFDSTRGGYNSDHQVFFLPVSFFSFAEEKKKRKEKHRKKEKKKVSSCAKT